MEVVSRCTQGRSVVNMVVVVVVVLGSGSDVGPPDIYTILPIISYGISAPQGIEFRALPRRYPRINCCYPPCLRLLSIFLPASPTPG